MRSYGQFCPVAKAAEVFCERWTALILRDLACGVSRFSDLQRGVPLMSPSLLSRRLRQLKAEGVVGRHRSATGRGWTYHLTPAGEDFAPLVEALGVWGQRWSRRELADGEVDLGLLLWALEAGARPEAFGAGRTVLRLELTDQPPGKRHWWFVNEDGRSTMCVDDPGFEVDLYVAVSLRDMICIWRGDLPLGRALESGRLELHGPTGMRRAFPAWLARSSLASIETKRPSLLSVPAAVVPP